MAQASAYVERDSEQSHDIATREVPACCPIVAWDHQTSCIHVTSIVLCYLRCCFVRIQTQCVSRSAVFTIAYLRSVVV